MIRTTMQYRQLQPEGRMTMVSMKQQGFSARAMDRGGNNTAAWTIPFSLP
jgi:hypothetical protein